MSNKWFAIIIALALIGVAALGVWFLKTPTEEFQQEQENGQENGIGQENGGNPSGENENGTQMVRIETRINQEGSALDVRIVPTEILEDSRCPEDVTCVWAGTVKIRALLTSGLGTANQVFELGQPITTEAEIVTLVAVEPGALSEPAIPQSAYRFIFEISKR